jgi:hypothetical protein
MNGWGFVLSLCNTSCENVTCACGKIRSSRGVIVRIRQIYKTWRKICHTEDNQGFFNLNSTIFVDYIVELILLV